MNNIRRRQSVFTSLVILIGMTAAIAHAVIFASDALYLYSGGMRIIDNSVLVLYTDPFGESLGVCNKGAFWLRQGPTWKPGPCTFILTIHRDILTIERWLQTPEGKATENSNQDYQGYLRSKADNARGRISITLPTVKESPALDRTSNRPPPRGINGGKIGHNRYFRVDLDHGTATQIPRDHIERDEKALNKN
ncbi:MAG TPA: hypothetical protein DCG53_12015 [Syntrophus sp. (in: bacteria)]|jgi:hypothetical protein|nr:hypothetical protein [Syntrophus sp. (in: bacteria)]